MPCLHHTDENGPEEYYVTPFDPPLPIKCQCPGGCIGHLKVEGPNRLNTLSFLVCDTCGCCYTADHLPREGE